MPMYYTCSSKTNSYHGIEIYFPYVCLCQGHATENLLTALDAAASINVRDMATL